MRKNKKIKSPLLVIILGLLLVIGVVKVLAIEDKRQDNISFKDYEGVDNKSGDEMPSEISLRSENAIMYDYSKDKIIYRKNIDKKIYPASMTKIMTAIIAIEEADSLNDMARVPDDIDQQLNGTGAAISYLIAGEELSIEELLYGTLLSSSADCTVTLAEYVSGSEEQFAKKMNEKARMLGMNNSNFTNSSGLHDKNHYSTVEDMMKLLIYALDNEDFERVYTSKEYISDNRKYDSTVLMKLGYDGVADKYIIGGKTGYTSEAGLCLASLGLVNDSRYIVVTSNADGSPNSEPYHILDAIELYDIKYNNL